MANISLMLYSMKDTTSYTCDRTDYTVVPP